MLEKGWFVPIETDGGLRYIEAEEGAENAVEGEFIVVEVTIPLSRKNPRNEEERLAQEKERREKSQ